MQPFSCMLRSAPVYPLMHLSHKIITALPVIVLGCGMWAGRFVDSAEKVDFAKQIQPLLVAHCAECHGGGDANGGVNFERSDSLFASADSGLTAIVPGQPQKSELLVRVQSDNADLRMPPDGSQLSGEQIELLKNWIEQGAIATGKDHPGGILPNASPGHTTKAGSDHWSFQPLQSCQPPRTPPDLSWPRNEIDSFIHAERQAAGFAVAVDAPPLVLLRRVTFGLTGLPPTRGEIERFEAAIELSGDVAVAFSQAVDDLLSRETYGQRWGRHWMDWVRYADTAGDNSDFPIPQAYLYRNYIISAFNNDVPYDRFLTEQLAGDLLPAETQEQKNEQLIATGYLAMARRFGSLVERYPWHLTIEDTIDNVGRTMLGLTISCARCHDHKFDPISTRDYYGLYGIFESTRYPFPGIELFQVQRDMVPLIDEAQLQKKLGPYQEKTDKLTAELEEVLARCEQLAIENAISERSASLAEQRKMSAASNAMLLKARKAGEKLAEHLKTVPEIPSAYAVRDTKPTNARVQIKGEPTRPGAEVPRKFPDVLGGQTVASEVASRSSGRLQLAQWITDPDNPLTARVIVNRVWQRHFGTGIVPSTSDFGLRGQLPTHPELLDWLAQEFIRSGWSIKHLQRLILNSRTYRLSSDDTADELSQNVALDPGNLYYWKANRQRLDAESIRDSLLLISGQLDYTPQTEAYPLPAQKDWEYTQHHPFKDEFASQKRSVYLLTKRLTAQPYFQTFDGPDPNVCTSDRDQSVTPLQALFFSNDEFLHTQAAKFTENLLTSYSDEHQRIRQAVASILSRWPSSSEVETMREYLSNAKQQLIRSMPESHVTQVEGLAWESLTRSLLRLNEFMYLD